MDELKILQDAIYTCLDFSNKRSVSSIVFPPVGKGKFRFSIHNVAEELVKGIDHYLKGESSNGITHIVICDNDIGSADFFMNELEKCGAVKLRKGAGNSCIEFKHRPFEAEHLLQWQFKRFAKYTHSISLEYT